VTTFPPAPSVRSDRPDSGVPLHEASIPASALLAVAERYGTPTYVYDARAIDAGARRWIEATGDPSRVCFAAKANSNLAVLARLERLGIGVEVATPGELARARRAGFPAERIVLGGVPKSSEAVRNGVREGVGLLVLQSGHEVDAAIAHATEAPGSAVRVGVRVRPGIRAGAHPSLETGRADAKFGFAPAEVPDVWRALSGAAGVQPMTLAVHLGSGLQDLAPYEEALALLLRLATDLASEGAAVEEIDIGGGLGVDYAGDADPAPADLVRRVASVVGARVPRIRFEPGRSIVARAGVLLTRVLYRRERDGSPALVCDAGYTDFARFTLYGGQHRILPVSGSESGEPTVEVLGPTCESGDVLGTGRRLHGVGPGDLLEVRDTGAYGFVMASNYNSRPRPAEVLVDGDEMRVVRERERLEDLWRGEEVP
jgi:diaminopimelate decarboxylase